MHSTRSHDFKSLRAVGVDNPGLEGGGVRRMGLPRTWGKDGGKCSGQGVGEWSGHFSEAQGPRRHPHEAPLPPKRFCRGQPQPRATGGQILAPACSESSSSLKWGYEAAHFRCSVSSFCLLLPGAVSGGAGRQSTGWLWRGLYWEASDVRFSNLLSWLEWRLAVPGAVGTQGRGDDKAVLAINAVGRVKLGVLGLQNFKHFFTSV